MKPGRRAKAEERRRVLLAMDPGGAGRRRVGIAQYAREAGWVLDAGLFALLPSGPYLKYVASAEFDGILSSIRKPARKLRAVIEGAGVPVVDLGQTCPELELPRVFPDNRAAGRLAADHLLDLGLRRLLYYAHAIDHPAPAARRDGFRDAAAARGVVVDELWWDSSKPGRSWGTRGEGTRLDWLTA